MWPYDCMNISFDKSQHACPPIKDKYSGTSLWRGPWEHENYLVISGFSLYHSKKTKKYKEVGPAELPGYIQGGPERMQRFWSVISTRFLIEYHWFLLYWIEYSIKSNLTPSSSCMDKAFWFYGYFSEAVSFSKCATFSPESSLEAARIFCLTAFHGTSCVDKCTLWKGRQHEWNRGIHYATLWKARAMWFPLSWWIETCRYASCCGVGKRRDRQLLMHGRSGWGHE